MKNIGQQGGNKTLGAYGEEIAVQFLMSLKYSIVVRNYRCKCGELDIIARDGKTLVFIEVKTRRSDAYGAPQLSVTQFKQRNISKSALVYMATQKIGEVSARFDVIAIQLQGSAGPRIDHIKNAFDLAY